MRSAETVEPPRLLLDESSLDFRALADEVIEDYLDQLCGALRELREEVALPPMWDAVECIDGCELSEFLGRMHPSTVDRDTLLRTYQLLDHCHEWEADIVDLTPVIGDVQPSTALSVAYALQLAVAGRQAACLVFAASTRRGFLPVRGESGVAEIYFFHEVASTPPFWRSHLRG